MKLVSQSASTFQDCLSIWNSLLSHKILTFTIFCIWNIFFLHLSVNGHLGCFHLLVIANNAVMIMEEKYIYKILFSFLLDKYADVRLLDHVLVLFLFSWGASILFFIVAAPFYIAHQPISLYPPTLIVFCFLVVLVVF